MVALLLAAIATVPHDFVARDTVDVLELNHFYDENGRPVFDQIIFWDWSPEECRFQVRAWRLLRSPWQIPFYDHRRGQFITIWLDGDSLRRVAADSFRETWTQVDPEMAERASLPRESRRELSRPGWFARQPVESPSSLPATSPEP